MISVTSPSLESYKRLRCSFVDMSRFARCPVWYVVYFHVFADGIPTCGTLTLVLQRDV